jgi:hypothetical protein
MRAEYYGGGFLRCSERSILAIYPCHKLININIQPYSSRSINVFIYFIYSLFKDSVFLGHCATSQKVETSIPDEVI